MGRRPEHEASQPISLLQLLAEIIGLVVMIYVRHWSAPERQQIATFCEKLSFSARPEQDIRHIRNIIESTGQFRMPRPLC